MPLRCVLFFLIVLGAPGAWAQESAIGDRATSGDTFLLRDGREVRLANVCAADEKAQSFLDAAVSGAPLVLKDAVRDRYGRIDAQVFQSNSGTSVGEDLVREGKAYVCPARASDDLDALMEAERRARDARRGLWSAEQDTRAKDAAVLRGRYGFVVGTVTGVKRVRNKVHLFLDGAPGFKMSLAARFLRPLKKRGLDPFLLKGERLRVRGWVSDDEGPTVLMADPHQMERLDFRP
ncbi:MAG: thermonuclease family protein [Alphaproteobacteria bacterium]|nr:thermonuclease family protein [Alphaproteobacteria bacterium]